MIVDVSIAAIFFLAVTKNAESAFLPSEKHKSKKMSLCSKFASPMDCISLPCYLEQKGIDEDLSQVICSAAAACADIAYQLSRLPIDIESQGDNKGGHMNVQGETQKRMDVVANEIFVSKVRDSVAAMASEEVENVIFGNPRSFYEIAFDPLDGSSNLDISAPTGTIFGISPHDQATPFSSSGRSLVGAGYAVYSSSVEFVVSLGTSGSTGAACFTLDPDARNKGEKAADCFKLSRANMKCPKRGYYYSLNEGREPDWPKGLRKWVHDAKRGETPSGTIFSSRYICSLCADVHRTLLKGGWAGNPRPHLRLLYEAAPLAHCAEACGGTSSDGVGNLLDIVPKGLHDRVCVFIGSRGDIKELEGYGDIQQGATNYKA